MPFQSQAQRRKLYATNPEVAKEFEAATPKGKKLPERKGKQGLAAQHKKRRKKKKGGTYAGAPAGSGKNFAALKDDLSKKKGVKNPGGLAAAIGRQKYKGRFNKMAAAGRKR